MQHGARQPTGMCTAALQLSERLRGTLTDAARRTCRNKTAPRVLAATHCVAVVGHAQLPGPGGAEGVGGVEVDDALASVGCGDSREQAQLQAHNRPAQAVVSLAKAKQQYHRL